MASLIAGILIYGCSEKQAGIKFVEKIDSDSVFFAHANDSMYVGQSFNLWDWKIFKDIAVIRTSEANDFIKVYTYPKFEFLYTFGEQGHSANEFITHNWCKTKNNGEMSVYDIMKRALYVFSVNRDTVEKKQIYKLAEDKDGLCRPYTQMLKLNDSLFLMKEDFDQTVLHLTNVRRQKDISEYVCYYREKNGGGASAYTPYSYDFDAIGDRVLLAYRYSDRMELLQISSNNELFPIVIMGDSKKPGDHDVYLGVCTNGKNFYCLKCTNSNDGTGNELIAISKDGDIIKKIILDREVKTIQFDMTGGLVGYAEQNEGGTFYRYDKDQIQLVE